jgi:hypothetical protein
MCSTYSVHLILLDSIILMIIEEGRGMWPIDVRIRDKFGCNRNLLTSTAAVPQV